MKFDSVFQSTCEKHYRFIGGPVAERQDDDQRRLIRLSRVPRQRVSFAPLG